MTKAINNIMDFLSFTWLTGPIFDKELRVSSRRKRNYFVRFLYISVMMLFLGFIWAQFAGYRYYGNIAYRISRMSQSGIVLTAFIVWFQFIAAQIVAGVSLSTSISDEIYNKTLGTLMTTPISSFQLVVGKLLSKLLQTILLIALSFPLLSIIRVFGGIPWDYVVSSLVITIITVLFVGSLSLFFSIFTRKAYVSIILTLITLATIFLLIPVLIFIFDDLFRLRGNPNNYISFLSHTNPYMAMITETEMLFHARASSRYFFSLPVSCITMLIASGLLITVSVSFVRKVALRQATGQPDIFTPKAKRKKVSVNANPEKSIRRIKGQPVLWKELYAPIFGKRKLLFSIFISLSLIILIFTYIFCASQDALDENDVHAVYSIIFFSIGLLFTIILPATAITHEKETRSWNLLLTTTLSSSQIAWGKFIGSIKRCLPAWGYLAGHLLLFTLTGFIHPLGILQVFIIATGTCIFLIGSGLLFSTIFKRTTTAVIMNFIFAAVLWAGIPFLMAIIYGMSRGKISDDFFEMYINGIPYVQTVVSMEMTASGVHGLRGFHWPTGTMTPFESTITMLFINGIYSAAGIFMIWLAKNKFRKKII